MSTTDTALTVHLVMPGGHPGDHFLADLQGELREHFGIAHATVQIELQAPGRHEHGSECPLDRHDHGHEARSHGGHHHA